MASNAPILVERADIHKSCKSLEAIISILVTYTETSNGLANMQKKLAKALKEAANMKGTNGVPANAMIASAGIFESLAEVDAKFSKIADKEVENVGSDLKKWFKKLSKEEKAHDEKIAHLNARIKLAGQAYEKKAKRKDRDAVEEHSRYVTLLNSVGPEMSKDKYNHTLLVTQRHTTALLGFSACLSRLAEAEWVRSCEHVRKFAPSIGTVGEWRVLCEGGWLNSLPGDLPDLSTNDGIDIGKNYAAPAAPVPSLPITAGANIGSHVNTTEDMDSPTSSSNSRQPHFAPSRPPSPSTMRNITAHALQNKTPVSGPDFGALTHSNKPESIADSSNSAITSSNRSITAVDSSRLNDFSVPAGSTKQLTNVESVSTDDSQKLSENPEVVPEHAIKPEPKPTEPPSSQPVPSGPELLPNENNQLDIAKKINVDVMNGPQQESQMAISAENTRPLEGGRSVADGRGLDRRSSVESSNSLVAAMRERYDTPPTTISSPPPRDLPRLPQKVSNLATRYTPLEIPRSPPRSGGTGTIPSGLSAERFPTFQDKYPQAVRDRDRFKVSPVSPTPERDYFDDRDKARYLYTETSTLHRNPFIRDDHDRSPRHSPHPQRSRSPDRDYFGELGVLDRQQFRIGAVVERQLQEKEAELREQERRLEIERAKLAEVREGGYTSDTHVREGGYISDSSRSHRGISPYETRRSESPGPMISQRSLRPYSQSSPYERSRRSESPSPMTSQQSLRPYEHSSPYERTGRSESPSPMTSQSPLRPYEDSSPYERSRRSESPSPMTSRPSSRPYDHSPNCGCQRCSAQHYASSASPSHSRSGRDAAMPHQQRTYKPDPPITLRSEKTRGWLRRMSMPLVPSSDKNLSVPGMSRVDGMHVTPEEVRRVGRRSFDLEDSRDGATR